MGLSKKRWIVISSLLVIVLAWLILFTNSNEVEVKNTYVPTLEKRIGSVELKVSNFDKSLKLYKDIIGFKELKREGNMVHLTADGKNSLLVLMEDHEAISRPQSTTGLYHFAILVPSREELALVYLHLLESGYPVQGGADHQFSEAIYLADPDQNGIEIYADRDPKDWIQDGKGGYVGGTYPLDTDDLFAEIRGRKWWGLSEKTKIGHMHLQVSDLSDSKSFYLEALGFSIVAENQQMLFVAMDGYHHHIGMNIWAGKGLPKPPSNSLGLRTFSLYFTSEEYRAAQSNLERLNYKHEVRNNELWVEDPSGNLLNIIIRD